MGCNDEANPESYPNTEAADIVNTTCIVCDEPLKLVRRELEYCPDVCGVRIEGRCNECFTTYDLTRRKGDDYL